MSITQLLYASTATAQMNVTEFHRIEASSLIYNSLNGITGLCCYDGIKFLQLIEGREASVRKLYTQRIIHDPRHRDPQIVRMESADRAAFGEWTMRCVMVIGPAESRRKTLTQLVPPSLDPSYAERFLAF